MLAVCSGLAPDNGTGAVFHRFPVTVGAFAVAFHICLLQIGWKTVQVLVVRQDRMALGAPEIDIPGAEQGHDDRYVCLRGTVHKMLIGMGRAPEQFFEPGITDR